MATFGSVWESPPTPSGGRTSARRAARAAVHRSRPRRPRLEALLENDEPISVLYGRTDRSQRHE